ncbi:hypothetical protein HGB25_00320 [Candidatus Saccharibacteria bacterium]|nr:hypothetical protein [Candidatus Saccharibacteria bacterium]
MPVSTISTFWETTRGNVLNDSTASLDHNSVAFRYKGSTGNGGYLRTFAINYGTREGWCAIDFTQANQSRKWWFAVDGTTYSTNKATQNLSQQSLALHRRQIGRQVTAGLEVEQVEMLHTVYPFVLSVLRVKNTNGTAKTVTAACSVRLMAGHTMTHIAGTKSFWGTTPTSVTHGSTMYNGFGEPVENYDTYTMTNTSGLLVKMADEDSWDCSETGLNILSPRSQATGLDGIPVKTVTIPAGETYTFEVIYGVAGAQGWTEAELLSKADELIAYGVENYCNDERNRINYWYDNIHSNINIGASALKAYLPQAFQYVEEQVVTQKSFNQYSLHGGWADEWRAVQGRNWEGEDEVWYPYPTSTMHQSHPYHYIQLQTGMDWVVKSELVNYANRQDNTTGSMGFHMWIDDVAYPYGSPYTEQMWVMGVYDYIAFTQDHAFLTEAYNGKTILERLRLAYSRSKGGIVNGLVGGADWHDGWGEYGWSYNSQGSMTHCMMLDNMVELDPTNASTYQAEATAMRAQIVSVMEVTNGGHTFYKRRVIDPYLMEELDPGMPSWAACLQEENAMATTHTWDQAILDSSYWGVIAGVNTTQKQQTMINDLVTGTSPRGYDFVYTGAEGLGVHNGNNNNDYHAMGWLCYQAWSEKFFELAIADSMLGNSRMIDMFENANTAKIRFPEQVDGPALNSGEPTYSATALAYKWLLYGIFGVRVALDGTVTANPVGVPAAWENPSVSLRVADKFYVIDGQGNITNQSIRFDIASSINPAPFTPQIAIY